MTLQRVFAGATAALLLAAPCQAQTSSALPSPLSRIDVAGNVGWLSANAGDEIRYDRWFTTGAAGLTAGWYWTDHLKTEIEAGWSATDKRRTVVFVAQSITSYRELEIEHSGYRFAVGQYYQFRRNALFHPYVGIGADVARERVSEHQLGYQGLPPGITASPPRTDVDVRPFAAVGFKAYMTPRAFFRTDLKLVVRGGVDQALTRVGFGFDF